MWWGLLIALLVAIWVYRDSIDRGRSAGSAMGWAIGTFLLLILFLPLHLITRPRKPQVISPLETPRLCPHCGKYHTGDPAFCPNCGGQLRQPVRPQGPAVAAGMLSAGDAQFCPYCGYHYEDRPIFCPNCDRQLRERTLDNLLKS